MRRGPAAPRQRAAPKPAPSDAALLAELGVAPHEEEDDEGAALMRQVLALGSRDDDEAALLRQMRDCRDEAEEELLRELGLSQAADATTADAEQLRAAVAAAKREAVALKQAGQLDAARAKLRESKQLQQQLDTALAAHADGAQSEEQELLAQLQQMMAAVKTEPVGATPQEAEHMQDAPPLPSQPTAVAVMSTAAVYDVAAPQELPSAAPQAPPSPAAAAASALPKASVSSYEAVLAAKREAVALKRAGRIAEAKAALAFAKELERRLAAGE